METLVNEKNDESRSPIDKSRLSVSLRQRFGMGEKTSRFPLLIMRVMVVKLLKMGEIWYAGLGQRAGSQFNFPRAPEVEYPIVDRRYLENKGADLQLIKYRILVQFLAIWTTNPDGNSSVTHVCMSDALTKYLTIEFRSTTSNLTSIRSDVNIYRRMQRES